MACGPIRNQGNRSSIKTSTLWNAWARTPYPWRNFGVPGLFQFTLPKPFPRISSKVPALLSLIAPGCIRQAATATHIYGKPFCQAESFTGFNDDWTEDPFFLKPYADQAFCLGLGRTVIHNFAHSPRVDIRPGNAWEHVSIHFNPNITWWDKSHAFLTYLARCQHLLQQGMFVA